jgi:hypothetical protein
LTETHDHALTAVFPAVARVTRSDDIVKALAHP